MKVKSEFAWAIEDTFYNAAYCGDSLKVGTLLSYGLMDVNYRVSNGYCYNFDWEYFP